MAVHNRTLLPDIDERGKKIPTLNLFHPYNLNLSVIGNFTIYYQDLKYIFIFVYWSKGYHIHYSAHSDSKIYQFL